MFLLVVLMKVFMTMKDVIVRVMMEDVEVNLNISYTIHLEITDKVMIVMEKWI